MVVIGINAFHGDSAACLFVNGEMKAAAEEERFRRIKHWAGFPSEAIRYCLSSQNLTLSEVDLVAVNSDPHAARFKKIKYALYGKASLKLIKEKLAVRGKRKSIADHLGESDLPGQFNGSVENVEHHLAHLASAFNVSPYSEASIVSVDGFGDFASSTWGHGSAGQITQEGKVYFPHSLGIFYQSMTQFLGFPHYGDEYKVMGLAPYGQPRYHHEMDQILQHQAEGGFELNLDFFVHHKRPIGYEWDGGAPKVSELFSERLVELFSQDATPPDANGRLNQYHFDLARSVQDAYERAFFHMLNSMHAKHGGDNLTIAGGCGMNSVANGKVHLNTPYKNIYVQSAAGDAGGAIGAAIVAGQRHKVTASFAMTHSYWGPSFNRDQIHAIVSDYEERLNLADCAVHRDLDERELVDRVASLLTEGQVVGWFQGAMEWGPRALGNRSILGDPRRADMKDILNLKIKRRESFRPFAPSVLREHVGEWFESDADVPFMMKVFQIQEEKRERIPAVTHVDGSGRLQTVTEESNARYYRLIHRFWEKTQVPMLLNTSFNENEPVVCHPGEALDCFLRTKMDVLVLGTTLITRNQGAAG